MLRKPARKAVEERISPSDEAKAKERAREKLQEGVPLTSTTYRPPCAKGNRALLVGERLFLCDESTSAGEVKDIVARMKEPQNVEGNLKTSALNDSCFR